MGSLHLKDSISKFSGRNGNLSVSIWRFGELLFCFIKSYSCLWMVLGGLIRFGLLFINSVYGCGFRMCLSGGFWRRAILSRSVVVQSGLGMCIN